MPILFKLKNGKTIQSDTVYSSLNVLAHAQIEEADIGSVCGGHGHCGKDKIIVTKGANFVSPLTELEHKHLKKSEIERGVRLGCQCFPNDETQEYIVEVTKDI